MQDKQPDELRNKILELVPCVACDGSGAYYSGSVENPELEQCQYCYQFRFPGADKLVDFIRSRERTAELRDFVKSVKTKGQ